MCVCVYSGSKGSEFIGSMSIALDHSCIFMTLTLPRVSLRLALIEKKHFNDSDSNLNDPIFKLVNS